MDRSDPLLWPEDFSALEQAAPSGWVVLRHVLDPALYIRLEAGAYEVHLGARLRRKNGISLLTSPSLKCNWAQGDGLICPLPVDTPEMVRALLGDLDSNGLTFAKILELKRSASIDIELDASVTVSANDASKARAGGIHVPGLAAQLYQYQAQGVAWMRSVLNHTGGVILADEMGLGKTIQIISLLLIDRPSVTSPALILCPTTLIVNWVRELQRFAPSLSVYVHRGSDRARLPRDLLGANVVITTYDTLVNDLVLFKAIQWSWLLCDEAQALKNPDSLRHRSVMQVKRERAIPVTGTPVENHLLDLWSLSEIAIPGLLGDRQSFEASFPDTDEAARALAGITSPIVLKRRVVDVAQDLPERIDVNVPLELGAQLGTEYESVRVEVLARYPRAGALVATGQLQLFCAHPSLNRSFGESVDHEDIAGDAGTSPPRFTPKLERALELLKEAFENNWKVLLFANFNACGPIIRRVATHLPTAYWGMINGSTPQDNRQSIVDEFTDHNGPGVLVLNPRAAGAGLNITAATVVIHYTQAWNPALEQQASARAHRRGQDMPVTVYHMYYVDTVEEVMLERAQRRRDMGAEAVPTSDQDDIDLRRALLLTPARQ